MVWRRLIGAVLMYIGAAMAAAVVTLCAIILSNPAELKSAPALIPAAPVTVPGLLTGIALLIIGRWCYGDYRESAPVTNASAATIRTAGFLVALGLGGLLIFLLANGLGPDDMNIVVGLCVGAVTGVAMIVIGLRIKPINRRSYLDD